MFFLGLCLWLDRGAPRRRASSYVVAFAAAALVLALPLGRLVHEAALPDAFTLIPIWQLGSYDVVVWSFAAVAVLAFALLPRRLLVAIPVALGLLFVVMSISVSRYVAKEASVLETAFFGESDPEWIDAAAQGDVAYFYDGEPHWNAVWSHVFWNRKLRKVYVLAKAQRVPGPLPQRARRTVPGRRARRGLAARGSSARRRRSRSPERRSRRSRRSASARTGSRCGAARARSSCRRVRAGVQGSGDIYGPASMTVYGCRGGTFELTLIAKGSPVTVRLDNGHVTQERTLAPEEIWRAVRSRRRPGRRLHARDRAERDRRLDAVRVRPGLLAAGASRLDRAGEVGEREHAGHVPVVDDEPAVDPATRARRAPARATGRP